MTLTEVSYYARRSAPFAVLAILVFLIIFYSVKLLIIFIQTSSPGRAETNPIFGKIKTPQFSEATPSAGFTFTLDTVEGEPVTATPSARVFFLPPPRTGFGYLEKAYLIAKEGFKFDTDAVKHRALGNDIVFESDTQKAAIDRSNFNFSYQRFFEKEPQLFENVVRPGKDSAEEKAVSYLRSIGRYSEELAQGKINTTFLFYSPSDQKITTLPNNINSNMVEVDFYRADVDQYPMVPPNYFSSPNYVLLIFTDLESIILRSQIKFFEKDPDQVGLYPIRSGQSAFNMLKDGKGYVVSNPTESKDISIKKMFLAYYDPAIYQEYLQPVYVFLGENKFVAYVPAVSSEFLIE